MLKYLKMLGPGLLYAGAAIGVSHLVQSTRAGALYGFELFWVIIAAHVLKYPTFEFAPRYAAATGQSLVSGYRHMGKWALAVYIMTQVLTMFAVLAAISLVTAGIMGSLFHLHLSTFQMVLIILIITVAVLIIGKFRVLDRVMKAIILLLTFSTIAALLTSLGSAQSVDGPHFHWTVAADLAFIIAFAGWMPAPLDLSVFHSQWSVAKAQDSGKPISMKESMIDFRVGFYGTALVAFFFLSLGAIVMRGSGIAPSAKGVEFANQLISMYTTNLGSWAYPIIGAAAFTTMLSTTITVVDAYPRVLSPSTQLIRGDKEDILPTNKSFDWLYFAWMAVLVGGCLLLISILAESMRFMVDLATTISFVISPILAYFNYRVINSSQVAPEHRPSKALNTYAISCIVLLSIFSLVFLLWRFHVI